MIEINGENYKDFLENNELVILDFWADWCGPCKSLKPIYSKLASEITDVKFTMVDTDKNYVLRQIFNIRSVPTLIYLKNGEEISRTLGLVSEKVIKSNIEKLRN